jgi:release factor glutamine methyltransferase
MEARVTEWEPATALFVPDTDPLRFYRRIATEGLRHLSPDGDIYFEINRRFGDDVCTLLSQLGYTDVRLHRDLSHNDRFVSARCKP